MTNSEEQKKFAIQHGSGITDSPDLMTTDDAIKYAQMKRANDPGVKLWMIDDTLGACHVTIPA